jgi:hypothetical protein
MRTSARLYVRPACEQGVEQKRKVAVLPQPSMVGKRPEISHLERKFEDKRVFSHLDRRGRRFGMGRENLHPRPVATPRALNAIAAETVVPAHIRRAVKYRCLDLVGDTVPLSAVERWARLDADNLSFIVSQYDAALCSGEG